jgi:hypothetical protein
MILRALFTLSMVVMASLPWQASAGEVIVHDELTESERDNMVEAWVDASYRYHALAASDWLLERSGVETMTGRDFDRFARPFLTGTFLTARYLWIDPRTGHQRSRYYFSASGPETPWLPDSVSSQGKAFEAYFEANAAVTRGTLGSAEGSIVIHTSLPGERNPDAHRADAEIRMLRSLERDMRSSVAGPRGRLDIYVSTKVCDSCEVALQQFATAMNIDIDIRPLSRNPESAVRKAFKLRRKEFMDSLQCDLALRSPAPSGGSSSSSSSSSPTPFDDSLRSTAFAAGCRGISVQ